MCLKTHESFVTDQESFLKHHKLFSMLICEIYDLLTLYQPSPLSSEEIFPFSINSLAKETPILQSRIRFVLNHEPHAHHFFIDEQAIIHYIMQLLTNKISKIRSTSKGAYYIDPVK